MFLQKIDIWANKCMTRQLFKLTCYLRLGGAITLSGCFVSVFSGNYALAQIAPDTTLGAESSVSTPLDAQGLPIDRIDGGAIRGTNLFHSFLEFNVAAERGAYFFSPANIQNILARVTGSNPSQILGTLGTFGASSPNLFLINPNGIIFGQNASLDVGGSFVATTANAARLGDTGLFSASEPTSSNLLSVNPSAFFFNASSNQAVVNRSIADRTVLGDPTNGLQVANGRSLVLIGGNVNLEGGRLNSPGGQIELGGVAEAGTVGLNVDGNKLSLSFPDAVVRADVSLTNRATVNASGGGGGTVQVQGRRVTLSDGSVIGAITFGSIPGGTMAVTATESVELTGTSSLFTGSLGTGKAGDLKITTGQFILRDGSQISTSTLNVGQGGTLSVTASESIELIGVSADGPSTGLFTDTLGTGKAGDLKIETRRLIVRDGAAISTATRPGSQGQGGTLTVTASDFVELSGILVNSSGQFSSGLFSDTFGTGAAGDLTINTERLTVQAGAVVATRTLGEGKAGNLTVMASDSVELTGAAPGQQTVSGLFSGTFGTGSSGDLTIDTQKLTVRDGAAVSTETHGEGQGGQLTVVASDSVELIGTTSNFQFTSGLFTSTFGTGAAGELTINTGRLAVRDGAGVSTETRGEGRGGSLTVTASKSVEVSGTDALASGLTTETRGSGDAGNLMITTEELIVRDGEVRVSSEGTGEAGNLTVQAHSLLMDNQGRLTAETLLGNGGNITLQLRDLLLLRNTSKISTTAGTAQQGGDGGNITIDAQFIVGVPKENSDITANAFKGQGGNINITTQGIYGLQFRPRLTPLSDITASSEFGLDGEFQLDLLTDVDPSRGLAQLPTSVVDASDQIDRRCTPVRSTQERNSFTITGRGGLPLSPNDPLQSESIITNWVTLDSDVETKTAPVPITPKSSTPKPLVEAQGWMLNHKGEVVLTASALTGTPQGEWFPEAECDEPAVQSQ